MLQSLKGFTGRLLQADMKQNGAMLHSATSETVAANRAELEGLHRENALLRDQLEDVKRERQKWQEEADSWRKQATALSVWPLRRWKLSTWCKEWIVASVCNCSMEETGWFHPLPGLSTKTMAEIQDAA
jgi:hypothetical protein